MGHTPGPWFAIPHGKGSRAWKVTGNVDDAADDVANVIGYSEIDEVAANARLIAAAPALLEALQTILGYNSTGGIKRGLPPRCVEMARAAIALATNKDADRGDAQQ